MPRPTISAKIIKPRGRIIYRHIYRLARAGDMADSNDSRSPTHTAYGFKREGRKSGRWLEIGTGRAEGQVNVPIRVRLDRLPIGGFTGGVLLMPIGQEPPLPAPQRPGQADDADEPEES